MERLVLGHAETAEYLEMDKFPAGRIVVKKLQHDPPIRPLPVVRCAESGVGKLTLGDLPPRVGVVGPESRLHKYYL